MNQLKSILVGIDFSDCSRNALEHAVRLARNQNARLRVLHVVEYLILNDAAWTSHMPREQLEQQAADKARQLLGSWLQDAEAPENTQTLVDVGTPLDCLLKRVREDDTSLLMLGSTGSSMIPLGAGTLATKCIRKSPVKVMLVHERQAHPFRRIVAGVDFSQQSKEAVQQAFRMAHQDNCILHFVHVFTGSWGRYALIPDAWEVDAATAARYRAALESQLRDFVGDTQGCECHYIILEAGNHGHGLAEHARRVQADLVVLGNKGRSNLMYVLLGSTVERLLREIPCSALVVRPAVTPVPSEPLTVTA